MMRAVAVDEEYVVVLWVPVQQRWKKLAEKTTVASPQGQAGSVYSDAQALLDAHTLAFLVD